MTVLITGATGFIGSHLVREYSKLGEKVVAVVHDTPVWTKWLTEALSGAVLVQGDVRDFRFLMRVINQYSVDTVVHLAAQAIVKRAHRDPINTYDINVMGTVKVLEACRQLGVESNGGNQKQQINPDRALRNLQNLCRYDSSVLC